MSTITWPKAGCSTAIMIGVAISFLERYERLLLLCVTRTQEYRSMTEKAKISVASLCLVLGALTAGGGAMVLARIISTGEKYPVPQPASLKGENTVPSDLNWSKLPDRLRYLAAPAEKYG